MDEARDAAIEIEEAIDEAREVAIEIEEATNEARDVAIEIEGREIEARGASKERGDGPVEARGAFFEESRRGVPIENPSIEITGAALEAIDSFSSTADASVSTIEPTAAIEEALTW
jgi:hypothetical protein